MFIKQTLTLLSMTLFAALLQGACALAQTASTGTIVGTVRDAGGAVVPDAPVGVDSETIGLHQKTVASKEGSYKFVQLPPGTYKVTITAPGFANYVVSVDVNVATSVLADATLSVGSASQTIEVEAGAGDLSLQTTNSSVGEVLNHEAIENLPTVQRQITQLAYLQPGTTPVIPGGEGTAGGGSIAGGAVDQNSITIDGINITDEAEGGYLVSGLIASFPIPVDAIEEFRGTVSNPTEDQNRSSGGQFALAVRRGSNQWHGLAYDYYQNAALNANIWTNNLNGEPRPNLISNRFGGTLGGPIFKDRTFAFVSYEGYRFPNSATVSATGITESLRAGELSFPDATGKVITYNFNPANGPLSTACGPDGNAACDPRGIGISPISQQYFGFYPKANNLSGGDGGFNTAAIQAPVSIPQHTDFGVARLDHNISQNWGAFVYFLDAQQHQQTTDQVDFNPAVTAGKLLVSTSSLPLYPRALITGASGVLTPQLTYDSRFGYNRQGFNFARQLPQNILPAAGYPLQLASGYLSSPGNDSANTLPKEGSSVWEAQWNNTIDWVHGNHLIAGGVSYIHINQYHYRNTQFGGTSSPVAQITSTYVPIPASSRPPTCATATQTNCLPGGDLAEWNQLYAAVIGQWDYTSFFDSRDAAGNALNAVQHPPSYDQTSEHFEFSASDTWQVKPSLNINYGLNFTLETPYRDVDGKDYLLVDGENKLIHPMDLLHQKAAAAAQGEVYNTTVYYTHPKQLGGRGIYPTVKSLSPRAGVSWNPSFREGLMGKLFGDRKTAFRTGYSLMHTQILGIQTELWGVIGNQLIATANTTIAPTCDQGGTPGPNCVAGVSPFRVGVDGKVFTASPVTFAVPYAPEAANSVTGVNYSVPYGFGLDPEFHPGKVHGLNASVQREMPGGWLGQVGWIGRYGRDLATSVNANAPPTFIGDLSGSGGQGFSQAFDAIATQLRAGVSAANVTPQAWFENTFGAGSTATFAANNSTAFVQNATSALFASNTGIDAALQKLGKPTVTNRQFQYLTFQTNGGWSNYNAGFVSLRHNAAHGLALTFNYTYARCLDTDGGPSDSLNGHLDDPYNPAYAYGSCNTEVHQVGQGYGRYELPSVGSANHLVRTLANGWATSYIVTASSGPTLQIAEGDGFAGAIFGGAATAAKTGHLPKPSVHKLTNGTYNIFADPSAVLANLRPLELSVDTFRSNRGLLHGLGQWNTDMNIQKQAHIGEHLRAELTFDFFKRFQPRQSQHAGAELFFDCQQLWHDQQRYGRHRSRCRPGRAPRADQPAHSVLSTTTTEGASDERDDCICMETPGVCRLAGFVCLFGTGKRFAAGEWACVYRKSGSAVGRSGRHHRRHD